MLMIFIFTITPVGAQAVEVANANAPIPLSPKGQETVVNSGTVKVRWSPAVNASKYGYEAQFNAFGSWTDIGKAQGITKGKNEGSITLDKYFVRQYGAGVDMRWRAWTIDKNGAIGANSEWAYFKFKKGGVMAKKSTKKKVVVVKPKPVKKITKKSGR